MVLDSADAVVAKGGSYLHAWHFREVIFLWRMLMPIRMAHALGKPCVLLGVSLGPFRGRLARRMTRACLNKCQAVYLREPLSEALARELGVTASIHLTSDFALALSRNAARERGSKIIGITARSIPYAEERSVAEIRKQYESALEAVVSHCQNEYPDWQVTFIEQVKEDVSYYERLRASRATFAEVGIIRRGEDLGALLDTYSALSVLIGTRLHSVLLGAVVGTPSLHIAYERQKGVGIMSALDLSNWVIPVEEVSGRWLVERVDAILSDPSAAEAQMDAAVAIAKSLVNDAFAGVARDIGVSSIAD